MAEERFLVIRLSSLGDIVHTLPAVHALRETFPSAQIDWVVETRWRALVDSAPDVSRIIALDRTGWRSIRACVKQLRAARYTCAIDFQGLYKSAALAAFSRTPVRIGFDRHLAREGGATVFYTRRVGPSGEHVVDQNVALAEAAGARPASHAFPLRVSAEAEAAVQKLLAADKIERFVVLSPGGGWRSKCWPAERYGQLARALAERHGLRSVLNYGPGEEELAAAASRAAGAIAPLAVSLEISRLMALLRRAVCVVAGDSGPLHLGVALGTPVVGLYGPTDPARNGPYSAADIVVRNARPEETTYRRGSAESPAMLSISVEQALEAVARRLGLRG